MKKDLCLRCMSFLGFVCVVATEMRQFMVDSARYVFSIWYYLLTSSHAPLYPLQNIAVRKRSGVMVSAGWPFLPPATPFWDWIKVIPTQRTGGLRYDNSETGIDEGIMGKAPNSSRQSNYPSQAKKRRLKATNGFRLKERLLGRVLGRRLFICLKVIVESLC